MPEQKGFYSSLSSWFRGTFGFPLQMAGFLEWITNRWGISRGLILWIFYCGLFWILSLQISHIWLFTLTWLVGTAPIWLLVALYYTALSTWIWYIQSLYLAGRDPVLLEVKMPREITKSPRAMELALTVFNISSGETTPLQRGWLGSLRPFWSLEIASFGGEVHFYIWTWRSWKNTVEATMYSYYPEVELHEVEDYASKFRYDPSVYQAFATDYRRETFNGRFTNDAFEINAYPIRTYVDFELDKDPKEEFLVDPLANIVEFMGSIPPGDEMWLQIVVRMTGLEGIYWTSDNNSRWRNMMLVEMEKLRIESGILSGTVEVPEEKQRILRPRATFEQQMRIESMGRNVTKWPYDVGMRGIWWTKGELQSQFYNGLRWMWRPVGNPNHTTQLRPRRWHNPFDYPWQDYHDIRWNVTTRRALDAYRRRLFYHSPWKIPVNVMTGEEIATLWHPVSAAVATPGIARIPATKAAPPPNLPK
ncbi:MAG TPA: hypothetical protein VJG64_01135 [Candidatus Paceibacterota bacterium]